MRLGKSEENTHLYRKRERERKERERVRNTHSTLFHLSPTFFVNVMTWINVCIALTNEAVRLSLTSPIQHQGVEELGMTPCLWSPSFVVPLCVHLLCRLFSISFNVCLIVYLFILCLSLRLVCSYVFNFVSLFECYLSSLSEPSFVLSHQYLSSKKVTDDSSKG